MSKTEELVKLFELKTQGVLTEEEFNKEKVKLLASSDGGYGEAKGLFGAMTTLPAERVETASNFADCNIVQMTCPKCKGKVQFLPGLEVLKCLYCGNEVSAPTQEAEILKIPNLLVPFVVNQKDAEKRFFDFLAEHDYVVDDIFDEFKKIKIFGVFSPAYLFHGKYEGNWTALSIVTYDVKRGDNTHVKQEQGTPISGAVRGTVACTVLASRETKESACFVDKFDEIIRQYQPELVQGFLIKTLGSCMSQAECESYLNNHAKYLATEEAKRLMPTSKYINLTINVDVSAKSTVCLLPLWFCDIQYNNTVCRLWQFGHNTQSNVFGRYPQDDKRVLFVSKLKNRYKKFYYMAVFAGAIGLAGPFLGQFFGNDQLSSLILLIFLGISLFLFGFVLKIFDRDKINKIISVSKAHRRSNKPNV